MTIPQNILRRFIEGRTTKVHLVRDRSAQSDWSEKDRQAYNRLEHLWVELDMAKDAALQHLDWLDQNEMLRREQRRSALRWTFAGMAALVLLAIGFIGYNPFDEGQAYKTITGEQKVIYLKDGSKLHLNTRTIAVVNYSSKSRLVELQQGEAIFDVAQDVERPFIVRANGRNVRVVGTRFNVFMADDKTVVTVEQGAVSVSSHNINSGQKGPASAAVTLKAGQQVAYTSAGTLGDVKAVNTQRITAWQKGRLIYDKTPLEQVVSDLNRYYSGEIRIKDAELNTLLVSGVYYISDRISTVRALSNFLPISYELVNQQLLVLEKK